MNMESQLSLLQDSRDTDKTTIIGQSQTPIDRLARYLEYVCRIIADQTLKEAEECKHEFLDMPMGDIDKKTKKSDKLNIEQKRAWQDYWMEQMRQ